MLKHILLGVSMPLAPLVFVAAVAAVGQAPITPPANVHMEAEQADAPPPKTALILKLQEQVLELQSENARLSGENASLKLVLLDEAKKRAAADIMKEWGGKPGETINWKTLTKMPAPPTSPAPAKTDK